MKRLLFFLIIFSVCFFPISTDFDLTVIPAGEKIPLTPSTETTDYIDATQSTTYGTISNAPPNGMGTSDLNDRTTLLEGAYQVEGSPVTLETTGFDGGSLPSGWSQVQWTIQESAGFYWAQSQNAGSRYLRTKSYNLDAYIKVTLDFIFASYDTNYIESNDYRIKCTVDAGEYDYSAIPARTSTTFIAIDTITFTTSYTAVVFEWNDNLATDSERIKIDDVEVCGIANENRYRFEAVFKFNSTELGYEIYTLYVVFNTSLTGSDDLDFYIEAGDTTPDNLIADNKQSSFSVDVTAYITDTTVYLSILDDYRDTDSVQTSAYISAIYLYGYSPEWRSVGEAEIIFYVVLDETAMNWMLIFLGLCMIPASTLYLVKGGRDNISFNKVFYFAIAFMLGWAIFLGGIYG